MTITVNTEDGAVFSAVTARRVVSQMRRDNWNAPSRKLEYMQEVAERVRQMTDREVRTDTPAHFLADLQSAGALRVDLVITMPATALALANDAVRHVLAGHQLGDPDLGKACELFEAALAEAGMAEPKQGVAQA